MRASATIAILCFASQVASSCAAPIKAKRQLNVPPVPITKTISSTALQYAVNMLFQAGITKMANLWQWKGSQAPSAPQTTRELLEHIQARANEELASRMYKRESPTLLELTRIDDLD